MSVIARKRRMCDRCGRDATQDDVGFSCYWPCHGSVVEREYVEMPAADWRGAVKTTNEQALAINELEIQLSEALEELAEAKREARYLHERHTRGR